MLFIVLDLCRERYSYRGAKIIRRTTIGDFIAVIRASAWRIDPIAIHGQPPFDSRKLQTRDFPSGAI